MYALRSLALASVIALAAFAPAPQSGVVSLLNASDYVVTHVYISDCDTDNWEEDLLGSEVLYPGDELEVELSSGCWDLMALVEGEQILDTYSVGIGNGDYIEWTITN
jgi:hypothetical protein